jgi:hypothetical protein
MEIFIVRFYRRTSKSLQEVAGIVENVDSGARAGFEGEQQLLDRLLGREQPTVPGVACRHCPAGTATCPDELAHGAPPLGAFTR